MSVGAERVPRRGEESETNGTHLNLESGIVSSGRDSQQTLFLRILLTVLRSTPNCAMISSCLMPGLFAVDAQML